MPLKTRLVAAAFVVAALSPGVAHATDRKTCIGAFEETQRLRSQNKLQSARDQLSICTDPACPPLVRKNCTDWMSELAALIPSLAFAIHGEDGDERVDGVVSLDGAPIRVELGQSFPCDPGVHHLRVEVSGYLPFEQDIVVSAGEQNRRVDITLHRPEIAPSPYPVVMPPPPPPQRRTWIAPAVGGAGVAFIALGIIGVVTASSDLSDLRGSCAPACNPSDVSAINLRYGLSAASFVVGALAIGAAVWIFERPPKFATVGSLAPVLTF